MAWPVSDDKIGGHQRASHIDGHGLNASYKNPSATGRQNYSHMEGPKLNFEKPWSSADKTLQESARPVSQLGPSKTVFPVNTGKARGAPATPSFAKATRAGSHSPGGGPAQPVLD
jgi:hypothetical protein